MQKNKNRILALGCAIMIASLTLTVAGFSVTSPKADVSDASVGAYYAAAEKAQTLPAPQTTKNNSIVGDVVNKVTDKVDIDSITGAVSDIAGNINPSKFGDVAGGLAGGLGDAIDGLGGLLGGLVTTSEKTTANIGYISPTPAASQYAPNIIVTIPTETQSNGVTGETVDYAATSNPYSKPKVDLTAGDRDESVKWVQWIFIFTHYALDDNGLTGVVDDATVAAIKKFQSERGLTVDGNITSAFVDNLELFYYEYTFGANTSESQTANITKVEETSPDKDDEEGSKTGLIIALVVVWVLAIAAVVLVIILAKKKMSKNNTENKEPEAKENQDNTKDSSETEEDTDKDNSGEKKSLEDLFN